MIILNALSLLKQLSKIEEMMREKERSNLEGLQSNLKSLIVTKEESSSKRRK